MKRGGKGFPLATLAQYPKLRALLAAMQWVFSELRAGREVRAADSGDN